MFDRIREDVRCVFERDPAARNTFEVLTTYPGVHAVLLHRFTHWLWHHRLKWVARMISTLGRWVTGIEIHPAARIGRRFFIDHGMGVVIGETADIGDDCTLYHGVTLGGTAWERGKRHPTLGNNVIIGAGAKVLGPIRIGDGGRIGSNAVVMKDVPEGATVVGVPAHVARRPKSADEEKRREFAKKIGFDAYAATEDMPDPMAHAVNSLLDHVHSLDSKVENMTKELNKLGGQVDVTPLPELDLYEIDSIENIKKKGENGEDEADPGRGSDEEPGDRDRE